MKDFIEVHEWKHSWAGILIRKKDIIRVEHSFEGDNGCVISTINGGITHCVETYVQVKEELTKTHLKTQKEHFEFMEEEDNED